MSAPSRILWISKRRPQHRDLLDRPYGRFFYLPTALAAMGHEVTVLLIDHRGLAAEEREATGVKWRSIDFLKAGPAGAWKQALQIARASEADWIVGSSDAWVGVIAARLSSICGARLALDAYDDFEAYMPWNLPLHYLWHRAVRKADLVTAAGPQLADVLNLHRNGRSGTRVLPMAADPAFHPTNRNSARNTLGLDCNASLFGYLGSVAPGRDVSTLWAALSSVKHALPDATCLASGRGESDIGDGVRHLGYLPDEQIPLLLSSLDVAVVTAAPNRFGLGSYPSKLYEAIACSIPIVCADLPNLRWIAGDRTRYYRSGDPASLAQAILEQLQDPLPVKPLPTWSDVAKLLEQYLQGKVSHS